MRPKSGLFGGQERVSNEKKYYLLDLWQRWDQNEIINK